MEEARQHPALGQEKRLFLASIVLGLLAPFVGGALQLGFGGYFLLAGILVFGLSRIAAQVWQYLRPDLLKRPQNKLLLVFSLMVWAILIGVVIFTMSVER